MTGKVRFVNSLLTFVIKLLAPPKARFDPHWSKNMVSNTPSPQGSENSSLGVRVDDRIPINSCTGIPPM